MVTCFAFLGGLITKDRLRDKEICRIIAMGKATIGGLTTIWKDSGIKRVTKVKLLKVLIFTTVLYAAETRAMRNAERKEVDASEMRCFSPVMGLSWMERKTNGWVLENIKPEWTLESRVRQAALRYLGYLGIEEHGMEKLNDVMVGGISGNRKRVN